MAPGGWAAGGFRLRSIVLVVLLAVPLLATPAAPASHQGCVPATTAATEVEAASETLYLYQQTAAHAFVYRESNGLPGLQRSGGCHHAADAQLAEACARVDTRIPGTIACIVET